jgi:hypothetical protein
LRELIQVDSGLSKPARLLDFDALNNHNGRLIQRAYELIVELVALPSVLLITAIKDRLLDDPVVRQVEKPWRR